MNKKTSDIRWRNINKYTVTVGRYTITIESSVNAWGENDTIFHWRVYPMFNLNTLVAGGGEPTLYKAQQAALKAVEKR